MKALSMTMEKYIELKQKLSLDPNFKLEIYDLVDYGDVEEVKLINENWVKIKMKLGGICGTDLATLTLNRSTCLSPFASFPAIFGHEAVGTVVEVGNNVKNISIGDRVTIDENLSCIVRGLELCNACKNGDNTLCCNFDKGDIAPGPITGFCKDTGGSWGGYLVAHQYQVFKIPDSMSYEEALIAEPLACAIHGVLKKLPKENETCVVVGCGTIGLATILALKALSKCSVIATARYPFQSETAKKLGADDVFIAKKDLHIKKIGRKLGCRILSPVMEDAFPVDGGADLVIDSVGNASSLSNSLRLVKTNGTVILLGYPAYMEIDWTPIMAKEIKIWASNIFSYDTINNEKKRTLQIALDLISSGQVDVKDFLTHKFPLENYKEALDMVVNKGKNNLIKAAFTFE